MPDYSTVKYTEIADEIMANAAGLHFEVTTLAKFFLRTDFLGDNRHFPHAHGGLLMACMGQIDVMSKCEFGIGEPQGGQTPRMRSFMERYLDARKTDEHRVAVQLMRHTLMHTGALRWLYDPRAEAAYTWRLHYTETLPAEYGHYTLTPVDDLSIGYDELLAAVGGNVVTVMVLNLDIMMFAADIMRAAQVYATAMKADPTLQTNCEAVYPSVRVQRLAY